MATATEIQDRLKGKARWLILPSAFATTPIGVATVFYCYKTFDLPPGTLVPMVVITLGVFVVLFTLADRSYMRRLQTLRDVGRGATPRTTGPSTATAGPAATVEPDSENGDGTARPKTGGTVRPRRKRRM